MSGEVKDGGPAFPSEGEGHGNPQYHSAGMTLRDWFAGQAIAALPDHLGDLQTDHRNKIAEWAYGLADAMIAARSK